ncbi:MAG: hypothetical protein HYX67_04200 [Candidatus Melainabacteria bacterium]|nr:hypothetical protein [Candidatus Melainabacteria bacterium]
MTTKLTKTRTVPVVSIVRVLSAVQTLGSSVLVASILLAVLYLNLSTAATASEKPELQITIVTDKKLYHRKDEVTFTEAIKNTSNKVAQIIDDRCGYGSDLRVTRLSDHSECARLPCSAGHTLKPGLRPGVRQFLKPGQGFTRKFKAFITDDLHLAFQNHGAAGFTGFSADATKDKNLPDFYFGCGQVFGLDKTGNYQITASYSCSGDWSTGEMHPAMPLWQGSAKSSPIEIEVAN